MNSVRFASAHVDRLDRSATLPAKFGRMLEQDEFGAKLDGKRVAIKMHVGGGIGYYTIHPLFVKMVVDMVKQGGGKPFLTDGSFSTDAATIRGYIPEVVGARVVGAGGEHDRYLHTATTEVEGLPMVELCGNVMDAEALIVFSHLKGHGQTGFGGAIKNIAMGCVSYKSRGAIHALMQGHFAWDAELCTHCEQCISGCPTDAIRFTEDDKLYISEHHCRYCQHCTISCPTEALTMDQPERKFQHFQQGMAGVVKAVLDQFADRPVYYINVLMNITPLCDCWGFSTPALVPDVGIMAGEQIVAIEQASLDLIRWENLIPGSVPDQLMPIGDRGHLFERIHGKDPYEQIRQCTQLGLGSPKYRLENVD